ncbi:MAG: hypothetical protein KME17_01500 [Cyanosarcina radialis HA8281-LM2]|jgi:hypothetical protein|nr:hypothetical protein [Cyanosarcina radialis HA8281-LM2]
MNRDRDIVSQHLQPELEAIANTIRDVARKYRDDNLEVLALLRLLEQLHREIREEMFQQSLPDSRHHLYALLKDIEEKGGWPYIERMNLRSLLAHLVDESVVEEPEEKEV